VTALAELEVRHSRSIAPTRRVALGHRWLPTEPAPGFGGVLLAAIVARFTDVLDADSFPAYLQLIDDLEVGRSIPQPRLRHRFQIDVHGLDRSRHRLVGDGELLTFELADRDAAVPQLLAAAYAAAQVRPAARPVVFRAVRRAVRWRGPLGPAFVQWLGSDDAATWRSVPHDARWALALLGFAIDEVPERDDIQRRFRTLVRSAHPDHGGDIDTAGARILELTEARRLLVS
jgi:hypothetical protein